MKFGGLSEKGRIEALMRSLKECAVFGNEGEVVPPKNEVIWSARVRHLTSVSLPELYLRAVSREKLKPSWKMALGVHTYQYELVPELLNHLVRDTMIRFEPSDSLLCISWHDIVVLWLCQLCYAPDSSIHKRSQQILATLLSSRSGLQTYYDAINAREYR